MKVFKKTFIVTGGANGMGRELVIKLLQKGARVAAVDLDEKALESLQKEHVIYKDSLKTYVLNISNLDDVLSFKEQVLTDFKEVEGLINVAGIIQPFIKIDELEYDAIKRVMDVNFYGTLYMVKTFLPELLEKDEAHIINFSSMGGFLPVPGQAIYGASKAA
ncbi:MAG: SDR family oxidoreductase, partial [Acholeplasmataceae bacterium]